MVDYTEVPEDHFHETIFAVMEKLPLKLVSKTLSTDLRTSFHLALNKTKQPIAVKEPEGDWIEQCLGKDDAMMYSNPKGEQQIIFAKVKSFMIQKPAAAILDGLVNLFSVRENILHTDPDADLLKSIMSIFPTGLHDGCMKTVESRMEAYRKLHTAREQQNKRPDASLVFLSHLYSIPNIESSVKLMVNLQDASELHDQMRGRADKLSECMQSIEAALPQIQQIFESMLLGMNVLKCKNGEALCFDINFFDRIMSFKTKTTPKNTLLFYIVQIFCEHHDEQLLLGHDSPLKTMLYHLKHNDKLQFDDIARDVVEVNTFLGEVRGHRRVLTLADPNNPRIEQCGLDAYITNLVHTTNVLHRRQKEIEDTFHRVSVCVCALRVS